MLSYNGEINELNPLSLFEHWAKTLSKKFLRLHAVTEKSVN